MSSKRMHLILSGLIVLLICGLLAGVYGLNNLMGAKSVKLKSFKSKSQALDQEQIGLAKAKKDIARYAELEKITKSVVPEDKSQAEAVREITNIAAANNISLASISFPTSTLGNAPVVTGNGTAPPVTPKVNPNSKANTLSQLQPVPTIPGVYQLLITVTSNTNQPVPYDKFVQFLSALEHNRRTAQVSTITLQPDAKNRNNLSFALTLNEYIKP